MILIVNSDFKYVLYINELIFENVIHSVLKKIHQHAFLKEKKKTVIGLLFKKKRKKDFEKALKVKY